MFSNGLKSCLRSASPCYPSSTPISDTEEYSQAVKPLSILAYKVEALEALIQQLIGSIQFLFCFKPSRAGRSTALEVDCRICISDEAAADCLRLLAAAPSSALPKGRTGSCQDVKWWHANSNDKRDFKEKGKMLYF